MMLALREIKRRVANWLLRGVELEELRVRRLKAGERTVTLGNHIDVGGGRIINIGSNNVSFDDAGILSLAGIPDTLTNKDADSVDGKQASDLLDKATYDPDNDGKVESADHADSANSANSATNASQLGGIDASRYKHYIIEGGSTYRQLPEWLKIDDDNKKVQVWNSSSGVWDTVVGGGVGDADTVDGKHASDFAAASHTHSLSDISGHDKAAHDGLGIDADTVDGKHADAFLPRDGSLPMTGKLDMNGHSIDMNSGHIDHVNTIFGRNGEYLTLRPRDSDGNIGSEAFHIKANWSFYEGTTFLPSPDNTVTLGNSDYRWSDIYAVNTHFGDIGFRERACVKCGRAFEVGDDIVLKVIRFDEGSGDVMAVPIHAECASSAAKVKVKRKVPVKEERWVWDERSGEFVRVLANKTVTRKATVKRLKQGYVAHEGSFYKLDDTGRKVKKVSPEEALYEVEAEIPEVVYEEKEFEI